MNTNGGQDKFCASILTDATTGKQQEFRRQKTIIAVQIPGIQQRDKIIFHPKHQDQQSNIHGFMDLRILKSEATLVDKPVRLSEIPRNPQAG